MTANIERVRYRRALEVLLALEASQSLSSLPKIWFDAQAEFESQIDRLEWEANGARAEARALAKGGGPG